MRYAVLGGGLAGLYAAYKLLKKNHEVVIFEASERIGGLLRSEKIDGFTFDTGGSHIIFSRKKELLEKLLNFLSGNYVAHRRNTKIYFKGKFIKYPFENGLGELEPQDKFFALYEYIRAWIAREKGELNPPKNFLEWIYYWFGKGIAELYLVPYNRKIWKYPLEKMSLSWVSGRVPSPPIEDVIKSAVGISTEGYTHQLNFYYPREGGIQALADAIADKVRKLGGKIVTGYRVNSLAFEEDKWYVNGKEDFDGVVSTIPLPELIIAIKDVPNDVVKAAKRLRWNSIVVVGVAINKPKVSDYHWVYFPFEGIFHRIAFLSNYSPNMAPEGKSSLIAEVTFPQEVKPNLEDVKSRVVEDLVSLRILKEEDVLFAEAWFWERAYVIPHETYDEDLGLIGSYIARLPRITVAGRWGSWRYYNMDAVIEDVEKKLS